MYACLTINKKVHACKSFSLRESSCLFDRSFGISFYLCFFSLCRQTETFLNIAKVVIRRDWFRRRASLPRNESGYICCWARENSSPIRLFLLLLISVRSRRSHCLIISDNSNRFSALAVIYSSIFLYQNHFERISCSDPHIIRILNLIFVLKTSALTLG